MRITLNLATRPFADLGPAIKRLRIAMGVLALVAIGLGFGLHALHQKAEAARDRDHSLDGQIARITKERQDYQTMMRRPENAQLVAQVVALNKLFDEKAFSWTLAMEDLETVLPGGVHVTSIEPVRNKDGHITIHLRVNGPRDQDVNLVRNLEHSRRFLAPRITGENAEAQTGPGQRMEPVSASNRGDFDLLAEYNPSTADERKVARKPAATDKDKKAGSRIAPRLIVPLGAAGLMPGGRIPYTGPTAGPLPNRLMPAAPNQSRPMPNVPIRNVPFPGKPVPSSPNPPAADYPQPPNLAPGGPK
jgi:type IV pilus assembly protein PilN